MTYTYLDIHPEVAQALAEHKPVVALESTIISHGMPYPQNVATALQVEAEVRQHGAVPATIAIVNGRLKAGLTEAEIEILGTTGRSVSKVSRRDIPFTVASGNTGATTVASTMVIAAMAGIRVFATGGIGGVHRGDALDVSCDLTTLASEPVVVVSAGAKAILDLPRTLEYLETLGVPVVGYQTSELPAFYTRTSGLSLVHRVDSPSAAAALLAAHFAVHPQRGVLLANPIPAADALDPVIAAQAVEAALAAATAAGVSGKKLTPFLLAHIAGVTQQQSLRANRALVLHNARVAAEVAAQLVGFLPQDAY